MKGRDGDKFDLTRPSEQGGGRPGSRGRLKIVGESASALAGAPAVTVATAPRRGRPLRETVNRVQVPAALPPADPGPPVEFDWNESVGADAPGAATASERRVDLTHGTTSDQSPNDAPEARTPRIWRRRASIPALTTLALLLVATLIVATGTLSGTSSATSGATRASDRVARTPAATWIAATELQQHADRALAGAVAAVVDRPWANHAQRTRRTRRHVARARPRTHAATSYTAPPTSSAQSTSSASRSTSSSATPATETQTPTTTHSTAPKTSTPAGPTNPGPLGGIGSCVQGCS